MGPFLSYRSRGGRQAAVNLFARHRARLKPDCVLTAVLSGDTERVRLVALLVTLLPFPSDRARWW